MKALEAFEGAAPAIDLTESDLGYVVIKKFNSVWLGSVVYKDIESARHHLRQMSERGVTCVLASLTREPGS